MYGYTSCSIDYYFLKKQNYLSIKNSASTINNYEYFSQKKNEPLALKKSSFFNDCYLLNFAASASSLGNKILFSKCIC